MKLSNLLEIALIATVLVMNQNSYSQEILVETPSGEIFTVEMDPSESLISTLASLKLESTFDDIESLHASSIKKISKQERVYQPVSEKEKGDISYIVNTLGTSSLITIAKNRSSLKKAGNRIDHVHPLQFLGCIFSDEQMKVSVYAMQDRGWIWKDFMGGLKSSLNKEYGINNLKIEFIQDFSTKLGVDPTSVYAFIQEKKWNELVSYLISSLPRQNIQNPYDF